ncbi:MAG: hypothetical protein JNK82_08040 [Myxococcaceae bacterium]|nr:hypothetical protein [Myxococcaceae bacterium]
MTLAIGGTRPPSSPARSLPVSWDVKLEPSQVEYTDVERYEAHGDVKLEVPLGALGLTKQEAKKLFDGAQVEWLGAARGELNPQVSIDGQKLRVKVAGVDGRGFFAMAPRLAFKGRDGVARVMTFRTPTVTLKEKDPQVRAAWGGSGVKEHLAAEKNAWKSTKQYVRELKHEVKDAFTGAERRERLRDVRELGQVRRAEHRERMHDLRSDLREQRHDRRAAEKADRKGLVKVETNQQ